MLAFLSVTSLAMADQAPPEFKIVKIEGDQKVDVQHAGKWLKASTGQPLFVGDLIKPASSASVEIESEDQTKIVVTGGSELKVTQDQGAKSSINLVSGKILGWVRKKIRDTDNSDVKYQLTIKTRTSVMGIRGTQFVVEDKGSIAGATIHVLEGVVDIAKDFTSLLTNNVIVATSGQLVAAVGDQSVAVAKEAKTVLKGTTSTVDDTVRGAIKAMPFDVLGFVADLNNTLPEVFHVPFITGQERKYSENEMRYHLSSFEFYAQGYFGLSAVPQGMNRTGIGMSWNPTWHVRPGKLDVRGHFGNGRLFRAGNGFFSDFEAKVLVTYIAKEVAFIEGGPIFRHFNERGNGFGLASNAGIWFGDGKVLRLIDRLFFGVNLLKSPYPAHDSPNDRGTYWEFRFGAGATFF